MFVGRAACGFIDVLIVLAKMTVVKPPGPRMPYMPTRCLSAPLVFRPATRLGAVKHNSKQQINSSKYKVLWAVL